MAIRDAVPLNLSATLPALNTAGTFTSSPTLRLKGLVSLVVELNVSAVPGGTPTLDVFVQTSVDGGATCSRLRGPGAPGCRALTLSPGRLAR
jgi:hypothetical protein